MANYKAGEISSLISLSLQLVLAALSGNTETETEAQQAASGSPGLAPAPMRAMSRGRAVFQNCPPEPGPEHRHHLEFAIHQHQPDDISRQFMNVFSLKYFSPTYNLESSQLWSLCIR